MKLVPFDHADLRLGEPLPVPLYDAGGRLLAVAGVVLCDPAQFASLANHALQTEPSAAQEWKRRVNAAVDAKLRSNALLKDVASARPDGMAGERAHDEQPLARAWEEHVTQLDALLRGALRAPGADWPARLEAQCRQLRALLARRPDASLYLLVHEAGEKPFKYGAHHALLSMAACELAAPLLGGDEAQTASLARAALTMNIAVLRLIDQLAASDRAPTAAMQAEFEAHPPAAVALLESLGFADPLALEIVARHHEPPPAGVPYAELPPARRLAALLSRADAFACRISRCATHEPLAPALAVREVCVGADGLPDEIGGALLRAVGLYPPGSFVELASGEVGIVLARGRRANLPYVATLVGAGGAPLGVPALRDTIERRFGVKSPVPSARVRVRPPHEQLLAMR